MTEQRNLKRRVRERMAKTGERYTAARKHVVADPGEPEPFVADPGLADATLVEKTGRSWAEWVSLLDAWGAREREHRDIARHLAQEHGVAGWWAQTITVGYERARGLRAPGQRRGGGFEVNVTRTVNVPVERLIAALVEPEERERWFPGAPLRLRRPPTATTARFDWEDGATRVVVGFTDKGPARSSVALQHERIADEGAAAELRALWKERLTELKRVLEG